MWRNLAHCAKVMLARIYSRLSRKDRRCLIRIMCLAEYIPQVKLISNFSRWCRRLPNVPRAGEYRFRRRMPTIRGSNYIAVTHDGEVAAIWVGEDFKIKIIFELIKKLRETIKIINKRVTSRYSFLRHVCALSYARVLSRRLGKKL